MVRFLAEPVDRNVIDRGIERTAALSRELSVRLRNFQTGYVRQYVLWFVLGVTLIVGYLLIRVR
jgi:NADH:ubiquinone oxidoreductase subunit 5 (subunit L)/multisubunit Na+/H+ antiporter MnhA subunit